MDSRAGLDGCEKSRTYRHFFLSPPVLSLYLFALVPFSLTVLADSCVFTVQHIHATGWIFFFVLCTLSVVYFFVLIVLALTFVLYCTTHTTQISMPPAGFEPAIPACERPHTHDLDRSTNGVGFDHRMVQPVASRYTD